MIIEAGFAAVIGVRFVYTDAKGAEIMSSKCEMVRIHLQHPMSGHYEHLVDIIPGEHGEWPQFSGLQATIAGAMMSELKPLARKIAVQVGWEVGSVPRGMEPGWETPMDRGTGWVPSSMRPLGVGGGTGEAPLSSAGAPLISAVPQPSTGLSDDQIARAARSASSHLANCLQ